MARTHRMRRTERALAATLVAILLVLASSRAVEAQRMTFRSLGAREAVQMVTGAHGQITMVLLYAAYCPHCRAMFPAFVDLADRYGRRGVSTLAFATDEKAAAVDEWVGAQRLPFLRLHIEPWNEGELAKAFQPTGIAIGAHFGVPLLALFDRDGKLVGQWGGEKSVAQADRWLTEHVSS